MYLGKYTGEINKKMSREEEIQECLAFPGNGACYN